MEDSLPSLADADRMGLDRLFQACERGELSLARQLLALGVRAHPYGKQAAYTPLMHACVHGELEIAQLLLASGAVVNSQDEQGRTALAFACRAGRQAVVSLLLEEGADVNLCDDAAHAPLLAAVIGGHAAIVEALGEREELQLDVCSARGSPLTLAARNGDCHVLSILLRWPQLAREVDACDTRGATPLTAAVDGDWEDAVTLLLAESGGGADVNGADGHGHTPLTHAACMGNAHLAAMLLAAGGDSEADVAMTAAVYGGHVDVVELLLPYVSVHFRNAAGRTHLFLAAHEGHLAVTRALLDAGADVHARDRKGWTPLCTAAFKHHALIAQELLLAGADVNTVDDSGRTALSLALMTPPAHEDGAPQQLAAALPTVRLLRRYEADVSSVDVHALRLAGAPSDLLALLTPRGGTAATIEGSGEKAGAARGSSRRRARRRRAAWKRRVAAVVIAVGIARVGRLL